LALAVAALLLGSGFEIYAQHEAARLYPPPGRLIDVGGGRKMHLDCRGHGAPTVVFQAGLDTTGSLGWGLVQDKIAAFTRACAYDRAGVMWSDPPVRAPDEVSINEDLHRLLKLAGEAPPFVLVGHSLGGPLILDYTHRFGSEVAGLVFVDPSHPDQVARFKAAGFNAEPHLGLLRALTALRWTGWTRLPIAVGGADHFPPDSVKAAQAYRGKSMAGAVAEADALPTLFGEAGADLRNDPRPLGDRPTIVLTALKPTPPALLKAMKITPATNAARVRTWIAMHDEETLWSTRGRQVHVDDASHYIQLDRPDVVIAAVKDVVEAVRAEGSGAALKAPGGP
jgi:pimeloyl-ACP methyl ester carboxylesterase